MLAMTVAHLLLLISNDVDFTFCITKFLASEHWYFPTIALTENHGKIPTSAYHAENDHLCYHHDNYDLEKEADKKWKIKKCSCSAIFSNSSFFLKEWQF